MIIGQVIGDQTDYNVAVAQYSLDAGLYLSGGDTVLQYGLYVAGDSVTMGAQTALSGRAHWLGYSLHQNTVVFQVKAYGDPLSVTSAQYLVPVHLPEPVPVGTSTVCPVGFFTRVGRGFVFGVPLPDAPMVGAQVTLASGLVGGGQVYQDPTYTEEQPDVPVWQIYPTIPAESSMVRFIYDEGDV